MKAIIFDIDGVITDSAEIKDQVINDVLRKHNLLELDGVNDILAEKFNRKKIVNEIGKKHSFNKEQVLLELDTGLDNIFLHAKFIESTINFIDKHRGNYLFFTNTSMSSKSLDMALGGSIIETVFNEKLSGDDGTKLENTEYILKKYNLAPEEVLFIDDTMNHIHEVGKSGVNCLHFTDINMCIENHIT